MAFLEWPIADSSPPQDLGRISTRPHPPRRAQAAAALLATAAAQPLPDADRARVPVIVEGLVAAVESDLRAHLLARIDEDAHPELHASLGSANVALAAPRVLSDAHVPLGVLEAALTRSEMFRLARRDAIRPAPLHGAAAAERMALVIAESRRVDPFGEPALELDDLPAEAAHALVWTIAAALRAVLRARGLTETRADALAVDAGRERLARYDEGAGLPAIAARLAQKLGASGALEDDVLIELAAAGELPAFTAALAWRAALPSPAVWPLLAEAGGARLALLLRAADLAREPAGRVLLIFSHAEDDPTAQLDIYDRSSRETARNALAILGHDPAYREALRQMGETA